MTVMIKVKLLKAVQPFNVGEFCGFSKEALSALPDDAYEVIGSKADKAARIKAEKATSKKKDNGGEE